MKLSGHDLLRRLGAGESIQSVCAAAGISRAEFDTWWAAECAARTAAAIPARSPVSADVSIVRNAWGIPHIFAQHDDLFFGYGYAMAQDRLWQMDYLRRKALGRLSEVFGAETIELDTIARTVGLNRIAAHEVETLPSETRHLLESFTRGVNVVISESSAPAGRIRAA